MITPLENINLYELIKKPIMFDANIFMVGIANRGSDPNCSFDNMKCLYLIPLFESFKNIIIHEMVYEELDADCKDFIKLYTNVSIVSEGGLYSTDPLYTTIFNNISSHERVQYDRLSSKNKGEVYSLAYAAHNNINYFSSKEIMVDCIANDLEDLKKIHIITYDVIILLAFIYHNKRDVTAYNKGLKSLYKRYCEDVIKRHKLPAKLSDYVSECIKLNYI